MLGRKLQITGEKYTHVPPLCLFARREFRAKMGMYNELQFFCPLPPWWGGFSDDNDNGAKSDLTPSTKVCRLVGPKTWKGIRVKISVKLRELMLEFCIIRETFSRICLSILENHQQKKLVYYTPICRIACACTLKKMTAWNAYGRILAKPFNLTGGFIGKLLSMMRKSTARWNFPATLVLHVQYLSSFEDPFFIGR